MVVLHGWYEAGKVEITDKKKPLKKSKVLLLLSGEDESKVIKPVDYRKHPARGIWENRRDLGDTLDFVRDLRGKIERRES